MLVAKLVALRRLELFEEDMPRPGPGEVLLRVDAVGICRSDVHNFAAGHIGGVRVPFPFVLGHETAGIVVAHGDGVNEPPTGARVAVEPGINCGRCEWCLRGDPNLCADLRFHGSPPVEGTLRQYIVHPARLCIPLDAALGIDDGVMLEPLAIGVHAVRLAHLAPGMSVAVIGTGPVGLMMLAVAAASGATRIIAADLLPHRLALATRYGATETIEAGRQDAAAEVARLTDGRGVDVAFEATTSPAAPGQAAHVVAPGGTVVVAGITEAQEVAIDAHVARRKGLTFRWVRRSKLAVEPAMALAASGRVPLGGLVTHRFRLGSAQEAFELVEAYGDGVFKAVVEPNR